MVLIGEEESNRKAINDVPEEMMVLRTKVGDLRDDQEFAYVLYLILFFVCIFTVLVLIYITVLVIQKVGSTDKIIPAMLIMLQLSCLSKSDIKRFFCKIVTHLFVYIGFGIFFLNQCRYLTFFAETGGTYNMCTTTIFASINTLFLALAVLLNINKWFYFTLRIQA